MTGTTDTTQTETNDQRRTANTRRVLIAVLVLLLLLLAGTTYFLASVFTPVGRVAAPEEAGGLTWVRSIYGFGNNLEDQLKQPNDVAIAPDGTIWITDQTAQRVVGFNPDGSFSAMLHKGPRGSSPDAFSFPSALAVDEDGLIYVCDSMRDLVVVMSADNEIVRQYSVPSPLCVAVRGDRIAVGSKAGFVILNKQGDVISLLGSKGAGDEQFDSVQGLAISEDTIYAVDEYNNRVSAYSLDGARKWIRVTGGAANDANQGSGGSGGSKESTAQAQMLLPLRATIDGVGRLVIVDSFDFSLTVLDPENGDLIAKYGTYGDAEGQFVYPVGISYDSERDWFAVSDVFNSRVQVVRIPDSGSSVAAPVLRTISGPLRACLLPLGVLLAMLVVGMILRSRRRKEHRALAPVAETQNPED